MRTYGARRGRSALLLALLGLLALLPACARNDSRAACPAGQQCLELGNSSDPFTLDPNKAQLLVEARILNDLMMGLTTLDTRGQPVPGMATSWDISPDGKVWTFHLRPADWSDGTPVTASDFVFGLRRLEDPKTAATYAYLMYVLKGARQVNLGKAPPDTLGARALDPQTLQLTLAHPAPYLPQLLTHMATMPLPAHVIQRWGDKWTMPGHFVSNGPYRLASWKLGDRIVLRRNPYFKGIGAQTASHICFDQIRYYPTTDPVSAERRVASGQLDMMTSFASNRTAYLRKHMPAYVQAAPVLATAYLTVNSHVPALADRRVRIALAMGVDRAFIADKLLRAGQIPAFAFVPPGTANYPGIPKPVWAHWTFARRQAAARYLLQEAGYGPEHPLTLDLKYASSGERVIAPALQADFRAIGVHLTLTPEEGQILFSDLRARAFNLGLASWYADFNDATTFLQLFASDAGPQNYSDYANPRFDALLARAGRERDLTRRGHILAQAEETAMHDMPLIPLYVSASRNLVNPDISGYQANMLDLHPKRFFCRTAAPAASTNAAQ